MDRWASEETERQDREDSRLVRPNPANKPPRRDLRRERVNTRDDEDPTDASDKEDRSKNYKNIGGSLRARIAERARAAAKDRIPAKKRETGETVLISPDTLKEKPGEYEAIEQEEDEGGKEPSEPAEPAAEKPSEPDTEKPEASPGEAERAKKYQRMGDALRELAKGDPKLESKFKGLADPNSQFAGFAKENPGFPAARLLPGVELPEGVETISDLKEALASKPSKGKVKKQKAKPAEPGEEKPKVKKPKAQKPEPEPKEEKPDEPDGGGEDEDSEGSEDEPKPEPTPAQKAGIGPPKRRPVNAAEKEEAVSLLVDTFPPEVSSELLAKNMHPDDVRTLVRNYNSAKIGVKVKDLPELAPRIADFYQTDPDKVEPPLSGRNASGEKVPFDQLTPDEQAEATRQHQLQVASMSLAAHTMLMTELSDFRGISKTPRIPKPLAGMLASLMLSKAPEDEHEVARIASDTFDTSIKSGTSLKLRDDAVEKLLKAVSHNPVAHAAAKAYLQANDYGQAKERFLKGDDETISEWQSPPEILAGLKKAGEYFDQRNALYGDDSGTHPSATFFRLRVLNRLRALDPKKAKAVTASLPELEEEEYAHHHKQWEKSHKEWEQAKAAHDQAVEAHQADPSKPAPGAFAMEEPMEPQPPARRPNKAEGQEMWQAMFEPGAEHAEPAVEKDPAEDLTPKERQDVAQQVDKAWSDAEQDHAEPETGSPVALNSREQAEVAQQVDKAWDQAEEEHGPKPDVKLTTEQGVADQVDRVWDEAEAKQGQEKKASGDFTYPVSPVMASASKSAVYHGVRPYQYAPVYPGWLQPHQRDLGEYDYDLILKSANEWLRSPLLTVAVDEMVPDSRFRAALDLAIHDGPYNRAINPNTYNVLLARLAKVPEPGKGETLLTIRDKKASECSFNTEQAHFAVYGPNPVTREVLASIEEPTFHFADAEGKFQSGGHITARRVRQGSSVTAEQAAEGVVPETLVLIDFPHGSGADAFKALTAALAQHGLQATSVTASYAPSCRKVAKTDTSTFSTTPSSSTGGSTSMKASQEIRKFAVQAAATNSRLSFEMLAFADRLAEEEKKMPPWLEKKVEDKKEDKGDEKKEASTQFSSLRALIIKQAATVDASQRGPWLPVLQALKNQG